jgi:hypothetical protein
VQYGQAFHEARSAREHPSHELRSDDWQNGHMTYSSRTGFRHFGQDPVALYSEKSASRKCSSAISLRVRRGRNTRYSQ